MGQAYVHQHNFVATMVNVSYDLQYAMAGKTALMEVMNLDVVSVEFSFAISYFFYKEH